MKNEEMKQVDETKRLVSLFKSCRYNAGSIELSAFMEQNRNGNDEERANIMLWFFSLNSLINKCLGS